MRSELEGSFPDGAGAGAVAAAAVDADAPVASSRTSKEGKNVDGDDGVLLSPIAELPGSTPAPAPAQQQRPPSQEVGGRRKVIIGDRVVYL